MVEPRIERTRRTRDKKVGTNGAGSLHAVETGHILVEVWNPAVDYGRPKAPTDEPLTTDGHPLVATNAYSLTQSAGLRRGAVAMEPRRSARVASVLGFTEIIPLTDHVTEG